jgi:phosphatidylinositol glycan class A protein
MKPFQRNPNVFGGTEYMAQGFEDKISKFVPKFQNYLSLVIPGTSPQLIDLYNSSKQVILWMHNNPTQFSSPLLNLLNNKNFQTKIKYIIVVSEFQKQITIKEIGIDPDKIVVIPNAIEPINCDLSKFNDTETIRIVNTSTAERGLEVLVKGIERVDGNFIVEVFNDYYPETMGKITDDPRIVFYGKTPKSTVIKAVGKAHIHAYPSIYPETFCLSQAEAMSAGLLCVTSDIGALPEVSGGQTTIYPHVEDKFKHAEIFAEELTKAIKQIKEGTWDPTSQVEYVNNKYCWEAIEERWIKFHELL